MKAIQSNNTERIQAYANYKESGSIYGNNGADIVNGSVKNVDIDITREDSQIPEQEINQQPPTISTLNSAFRILRDGFGLFG